MRGWGDPVVLLGVVSTATALGIAAITWRRRESQGAPTYVVLMLVLAVWSTLYVAQVLSPTLPAKRTLFATRHALSPIIALLFWVFAARYTDRPGLLSTAVLGPLVAVGAGLVAATALNPGGLYWSSMALAETGSGPLLAPTLGPLFWLNVAYILGVVGAGHYVVVQMLMDTFAAYRTQVFAISAVGVVEFALTFLFLSEHTTLVPALNPWPHVQLITYGATIAAVPLGWSYFNEALFDIQPLARQTVIESMDDAVFVIDSDGVVRTTNAAANRLLGRPTDDPVESTPARELFDDRPQLFDRYAGRVRADGGTDSTTSSFDCVVDGTTRHYDVGVSRITNSAGESRGVVVVARDVTEQHRQRRQLHERTAELERKTAQLEQRNERLDLFGKYVSHDLRNPIQVASGHVELARATGDLSHLDDVERAIERMDEMIGDLRELTTVDEQRLDPTTVDLASVTRSAWSHVETGDATLSIADSQSLRADRDYLLHVLENLVRNSVEHGSTGNRTESDDSVEHGSTSSHTGSDDRDPAPLSVTVGSLADGFYVADDGVGIPPESREEVLDHGYSTAPGGTGLGMSIVNTIATAHGWTVTVSESETGGARFEFTDVEIA